MQVKTLNLGATLPLVAAGVLGFSGAANAAIFSNGDTFNFGGALQLDNRGGVARILFTDLGATLPGTSTDTALSDDTAAVGDYGEFFALATGTGAFSSISAGDVGEIQSLDNPPLTNIAQFIKIGDFIASIDELTINIVPGVPGAFEFTAFGSVTHVPTGETVDVQYVGFTAQGLFDNGVTGGDVFAGDNVTGIGSYSGTKIVVVQAPEASTTFGLLGLSGLVLAGGLAKRKRSNLS